MKFARSRVCSLIALFAIVALVAACGGDSSDDDTSDAGASDSAADGVRVVSVDTAAATLEDPPEGLVVLDVRTTEEIVDARITDDATIIDFYEDDFEDRIAELDRDAPYLLYCRSGNRSGQTRTLMEQLGFTNVADVDGGILAWQEGGQPVESG